VDGQMKEFFGSDGLFLKILNRTSDLIILNLVFLISCIPLITIGSALSALYTVTLKMAKEEEAYLVKSYFKAFKSNFICATGIFAVIELLGVWLYIDFFYTQYFPGFLSEIFRTVFLALFLLLWMMTSYMFPLIAQFRYEFKMYFTNSLFLSMRHILRTVLILLVNSVPLICLWHGGMALVYGITGYIVIGFALGALINSYCLTPVFQQYIAKIEAEEEKIFEEKDKTDN
jgi:uncharacterized membrane protein YesL